MSHRSCQAYAVLNCTHWIRHDKPCCTPHNTQYICVGVLHLIPRLYMIILQHLRLLDQITPVSDTLYDTAHTSHSHANMLSYAGMHTVPVSQPHTAPSGGFICIDCMLEARTAQLHTQANWLLVNKTLGSNCIPSAMRAVTQLRNAAQPRGRITDLVETCQG